MENLSPLQRLNAERIFEEKPSKRCHAACCNKEHRSVRSEVRSSSSSQNLQAVNLRQEQDESLITFTSNDETPLTRKESKDDLRKYIKMVNSINKKIRRKQKIRLTTAELRLKMKKDSCFEKMSKTIETLIIFYSSDSGYATTNQGRFCADKISRRYQRKPSSGGPRSSSKTLHKKRIQWPERRERHVATSRRGNLLRSICYATRIEPPSVHLRTKFIFLIPNQKSLQIRYRFPIQQHGKFTFVLTSHFCRYFEERSGARCSSRDFQKIQLDDCFLTTS